MISSEHKVASVHRPRIALLVYYVVEAEWTSSSGFRVFCDPDVDKVGCISG